MAEVLTEFRIRPWSSHHSSSSQSVPLSALDYVAPPMVNCWALFFASTDHNKTSIITLLGQGLKHVIIQSPWLAGTFQKDGNGGYSIETIENSSVAFVVQHLDHPHSNYPSFKELQADHFRIAGVEHKTKLWLKDMEGGTLRPPQPGLAVFGVKLSFIEGGFVLVIHTHHSTVDGTGFSNIVRQWANCICDFLRGNATLQIVTSNSESHVIQDEAPIVDPPGMKTPALNPMVKAARKAKAQMLFYLPPDKAAELEKAATSDDGSMISTYDAFVALWWRLLTRHRQKLYNTDPQEPSVFHEAIDMRSKLHGRLQVPLGYQGNFWARGTSMNLPPDEQLTVGQVCSESPLSQLAAVVRKVTNSVGEDDIQRTIDAVARMKEKRVGASSITSLPMAVGVTDWRSTKICGVDFGFGKPAAFRRLTTGVHGMTVAVYPPQGSGSLERGVEFDLLVEKEIVHGLCTDKEVLRWVDFLGERA